MPDLIRDPLIQTNEAKTLLPVYNSTFPSRFHLFGTIQTDRALLWVEIFHNETIQGSNREIPSSVKWTSWNLDLRGPPVPPGDISPNSSPKKRFWDVRNSIYWMVPISNLFTGESLPAWVWPRFQILDIFNEAPWKRDAEKGQARLHQRFQKKFPR